MNSEILCRKVQLKLWHQYHVGDNLLLSIALSEAVWDVMLNRTGYLLYEHTHQKAVKWMMVSYSTCRTPPTVGIAKVTLIWCETAEDGAFYKDLS